MSHFRILLAATATLAVVGVSRVDGQPPAPAELLAAMRSGADDLVKLEQAETSYRCRVIRKQQQQLTSDSTLRIWRSGEDILLETTNKRGGLNANYMFGVERGQSAGEWKLTEFVDTERVQVFDRHLAPYRFVLFPLTTLGGNVTLQELLDNPKFRLTATRPGPVGTIEADFVTEVTSPNAPPNTPPLPLTGTFTVSAKRPGLVLAYTHTISSGPKALKFTMTRQVDEVGAGYRCKSLTCEWFDTKKGGVFQTHQIEFTDYGADPIDRSEFYLSHYGIPEPVGVVPPSTRTPRYVWLLLAAGVFAVSALVFRWQARRWRSAPAASMPTPVVK